MKNKTIYALSTFYGQSSVAVVRISGPESLNIAKKVCKLVKIKPRFVNYCKLVDDLGKVFDEGLAIYFKNPILLPVRMCLRSKLMEALL